MSQLARLALAGQVILLLSAWVLPVVSEYGLVGDNISELALGKLGFVQTAALVITGITTVGLAVAIRQLTDGARGLIGSLLVGVYGVGALASAIFPTDRIDDADDFSSLSVSGAVHIAAAIISFVCVIAGMFVLTWTFMGKVRWQPISWWWMLFPAAALSLLFVQTEGPLVGIFQRLLVTVISAWLILVALRINAIVAAPDRATPAPADR